MALVNPSSELNCACMYQWCTYDDRVEPPSPI